MAAVDLIFRGLKTRRGVSAGLVRVHTREHRRRVFFFCRFDGSGTGLEWTGLFFCCAFLLWLRAGGVGIQFSGANCTTQQTCYTDRVPRGWLSCLVLWIGQQCSQRGIFIFQLHRLQGVQVFAFTTLIQNIILDR